MPEFMRAFKALASKEAIISDLSAMTKVQLLDKMGSMGQYRYKNEKKDEIVNQRHRLRANGFRAGCLVVAARTGARRPVRRSPSPTIRRPPSRAPMSW